MESALRFSYGTPLSMPLRAPSAVTAARATRVQFNSSHSSLSLSTGSTSRAIGHPFTPVINTFDRSSMPSINKGAHKTVIGTVGVSLELACGFGVNGSTSRVNRKSIVKAFAEEMGPMRRKGPKLLFAVIERLASSTIEPSKIEVLFEKMKPLVSNETDPSKLDVFEMKLDWKMKSVDWKVNSDGAAEELKKLRAEVVNERKNDPQLAESMEKELVEFFIGLGKFEEALDFINTLDDAKNDTSYHHYKKSRYLRYKAITHAMLAQDFWRKSLEN